MWEEEEEMSNKPKSSINAICKTLCWMALLILIALCLGDPDLLDAIRDWIERQP